VGPAQLRDTLSPGNRMLGDVDPHAVLREVPPEEYDGYRYFTLSLKPELAATDAAAQRDLEQRFREAGATMLPVAVDGEVTVDSLGNRTSMRIVYRYRVRNGARWETAEVTKTYVESRAPAPEGVALDIPTEAAILLAEARDAAPAETGPPR